MSTDFGEAHENLDNHPGRGLPEPLADAQLPPDSQAWNGVREPSGEARRPRGSHTSIGLPDPLADAHHRSDSRTGGGVREPSGEAHVPGGSHARSGLSASLANAHYPNGSQSVVGVREPSGEAQSGRGSQCIVGLPDYFGETHCAHDGHKTIGLPDLAGFTELRIVAECFEDAQKARIANENRVLRGGIDPGPFEPLLTASRVAEHQYGLALGRCYRRVAPPAVQAWEKATLGIGPHTLARWLGTVGHPRIANPSHWEGEGKDRELIPDMPFERSLRQLWAYCGHGDPTRKRRKGMTAEDAFALGNPRAKMLTYLMALAAKKQKDRGGSNDGPEAKPLTARPNPPEAPSSASIALEGSALRDPTVETPSRRALAMRGPASRHLRYLYEDARVRYTDHEGWTPGHQDAAAIRLVGKQILRELWEVSA